MILLFIRIFLVVATVGSIVWFVCERGFEPMITTLGLVVTFLATFNDKAISVFQKSPQFSVSPRENDRCAGPWESNTLFFDRFRDTFPGIRGVQHFKDPIEATDLVVNFLSPPLTFSGYTPFWWWRGLGNNPIRSFIHLDHRKVLMDGYELSIKRIAAASLSHPSKVFIYVECYPDKPSGSTKFTKERRRQQLETFGYVIDEFALYQNKVISREEHDDDVALINGTRVNLEGKSEVRIRYLSPYNFVIAPQASPINSNSFDGEFDLLMKGILKKENTIDDLAKSIFALPRNKMEHPPNPS